MSKEKDMIDHVSKKIKDDSLAMINDKKKPTHAKPKSKENDPHKKEIAKQQWAGLEKIKDKLNLKKSVPKSDPKKSDVAPAKVVKKPHVTKIEKERDQEQRDLKKLKAKQDPGTVLKVSAKPLAAKPDLKKPKAAVKPKAK